MVNPFRTRTGPPSVAPQGRARRSRAVLGLTAALVGLVALGTAVALTSSAWTNTANVRATASTGTWGDSCVWVYVATGQPVTPAPACTISSVAITPYYGAGINYSDPTTGRAAGILVTFSPAATSTMVPVITMRLNQGIIPANWAWTTSKLASSQVTQTGTCKTLPNATGLKGLAYYSNAQFVLWEKASPGGDPTVCTGS